MGRFLKLAKNAIQIYEEQGSPLTALNYVAKYIARRGPSVISRKLRVKRPTPAATTHADGTTVAILTSGGVGDSVVIARYIRDLQKCSGPLTLDVFSSQPTISEWVFRNVPGIRQHFPDTNFEETSNHYDLGLFASSFVQIRHTRLADESRIELISVLKTIATSNQELKYYIDNHPLTDGFLGQHLQFQNVTRPTSLHHLSGIRYGGDRFSLPRNPASLIKYGLDRIPYITVHNGFEVHNITSGARSTKCYPHFDQVILILKKRFPDIHFVQLGSKTSTPIPSVHVDLIGKTTLEEASTLIGEAICHIDNESGLVHIASCHGTPCCVVYGPTPPDYFVYKGNTAARPLVCGSCWWTTRNWMDRCPRGFSEPICTHTQSPNNVAESASLLIREAAETRRQSVSLVGR